MDRFIVGEWCGPLCCHIGLCGGGVVDNFVVGLEGAVWTAFWDHGSGKMASENKSDSTVSV